MTDQPYYVDKRSGCVAVCDRKKYELCLRKYGSMPGLHEDDPHVVKYWSGAPITNKCPTCGHETSSGWEVPEASINAAHQLCNELNTKTSIGECKSLFERRLQEALDQDEVEDIIALLLKHPDDKDNLEKLQKIATSGLGGVKELLTVVDKYEQQKKVDLSDIKAKIKAAAEKGMSGDDFGKLIIGPMRSTLIRTLGNLFKAAGAGSKVAP